jgi:hypothetical protein
MAFFHMFLSWERKREGWEVREGGRKGGREGRETDEG